MHRYKRWAALAALLLATTACHKPGHVKPHPDKKSPTTTTTECVVGPDDLPCGFKDGIPVGCYTQEPNCDES